MSKHLTPLQVCEALIAPITELSQIAGSGEKSGYYWRRSSNYRDAGDMPPRVNRRILAHAARHHLPLTEAHLIWGAPYDEIEQLLETMGRTMPVHLRARRPVSTSDDSRVAAE